MQHTEHHCDVCQTAATVCFSWDEMARYDLPTMVNFVVNHTRQKQLYYIGHSQGTLTAFAHASQVPQFAKQVGCPVIRSVNDRERSSSGLSVDRDPHSNITTTGVVLKMCVKLFKRTVFQSATALKLCLNGNLPKCVHHTADEITCWPLH